MDKVIVRLPEGMRDRLKEAAADNQRSMNAEIVARLLTTFEMDDYVPKHNAHPDDRPERAKQIIAELQSIIEALSKD